MLDINEANFEAEVLQSALPVLVDFYGVWCPPCRQIAPMLDKLATENADKVKVVKVNVDENLNLVQKYQISAIPVLLFFKNGNIAEGTNGPLRFVGVTSESVLKEAVAAL
jgi:thioredoxin 1